MFALLRKIHFGTAIIQVPKIDISRYLNKSQGWQQDCKTVAQTLHKYGLIYVKDSRFDPKQNSEFIDLMEKYFDLRSKQFENGQKHHDVSDQEMPIGLKHCYEQKFISYRQEKEKLREPHLSLTPMQPYGDPTWRFHWVLNSKNNVLPREFTTFATTMDCWGNNLKKCGLIIAEMTALGLNLQKQSLSRYIINGDFYLSPTGIDLSKTTKNQVITAFHRDFDLLTVHGKSRYTGLYAWLNTGHRFLVNMPDEHLLVQGGKQLEWITGGHIKAGFHEVVHNEMVEITKQANIRDGKLPWRIASTLFCQVQQSLSLRPLREFRTAATEKQYPDITAKQYILQQLKDLIQH